MRMEAETTKLPSSYYYMMFPVGWTDYDEVLQFFSSILCEEQLEVKRCVSWSGSYQLPHKNYITVWLSNYFSTASKVCEGECKIVIKEIWSVKRRVGNLGILVHIIKNRDSSNH
jgi:hypothetical protein